MSETGCDDGGSPTLMPRLSRRWLGACALAVGAWLVTASDGAAQDRRIRTGTGVPLQVKRLYADALQYLVKTQSLQGTWSSSHGQGPGITGICCLTFLSVGEDPNFGAYAEPLRKGFRAILRQQNSRTGLFSQGGGSSHSSMYEQGFATLAIAEAYGAIDDRMLWAGSDTKAPRTLGQALELAVGAIITSQDQNPHSAWRYGPTAKDNDTSVSGACFVALLAARNAGIEVPDANIDKALKYYQQATMKDGTVMYTLGMGGMGMDSLARSSICSLVYALAKRKETEIHRSTVQYLSENVESPISGWPWYTRYYMAQALFQGDFESWQKWNEINTESLEEQVHEDGSIAGNVYSTGMALLSMALNYRFLPIYER